MTARVGKMEKNIETMLVERLINKRMTIASCESCTGGLISKRITDVSGASEVFGYGLCTYANDAKMKLLGVKSDTLEKYGAVSEAVAKEMAMGLLKLSGADIAISTTGIAGPTGGTPEKPVGLVYTAIAAKDGYIFCKKLLLCRDGMLDRGSVRSLAADEALSLAAEYLERIS